jgi:hypothetical protein
MRIIIRQNPSRSCWEQDESHAMPATNVLRQTFEPAKPTCFEGTGLIPIEAGPLRSYYIRCVVAGDTRSLEWYQADQYPRRLLDSL